MTFDVSVTVNFHREGIFADPACRSLATLCEATRSRGLRVEAIAILDRSDSATRSIIDANRRIFDMISEVDNGDLGKSRNDGVLASSGEFVAFLDGDDLWGSDWLSHAHRTLTNVDDQNTVVHPEFIYYFNSSDFERTSLSDLPSSGTKSVMMRHTASTSPFFNSDAIRFNNIFTANIFGRRSLLQQYPYLAVDRSSGVGVEDWLWNARTLAQGVRHEVAPDTVHIIRLKEFSLGIENTRSGLLPNLYDVLLPLGGASIKQNGN